MSTSQSFGSWEAAVRWLREQPDRRDLVIDAYYDDPLTDAARRYWNGDEWKAIRLFFNGRSGHALDIGAGRGIASYALAREGFSVTALEPDPSSLVGAGAIRKLAQEASLPIVVCEEFSEKLPFPDASFDIVFGRAVLHHARDLPAACREVFRVLKPGGRFIAVREHVISRRHDLPVFLAAHPLHHLYGGENAFLLDEYLAAIRDSGLRVSEVLLPLLSPINYFPQTRESICQELCSRADRFPGAALLLRRCLTSEPVYRGVLRMLTYVDNRPGRLYSFVADKVSKH